MIPFCPRCGFRDLSDAWICWRCADGVADAERAVVLVDAAAGGSKDALRILSGIRDGRALDVLLLAARHDDLRVRSAALEALGLVGAATATPIVAENLVHPEERVRHASIDCLAELASPPAADLVAARLDEPADRVRAAMALAWLRDGRALEPLLEVVESLPDAPQFFGHIFRNPVMALAWLGERRAIAPLVAVLDALADRWLERAAVLAPQQDWARRSDAESVAAALTLLAPDEAREALARAQGRFGGLAIYLPSLLEATRFRFRAPADPRRTVPRWSLEARPAHAAVTEPVTKFGGQPAWRLAPTWPLGADGGPMIFVAQFVIPGENGMAYLFLDPSDGVLDDGTLILQPGAPPATFQPRATGPTFPTEIQETNRYVPRMSFALVESVVTLEPGAEPEDWDAFDATRSPDDDKDDDRDWNKVGGSPRFLQGPAWPDGDGWRFLFQFTTSYIGHDLGEGTELYGFVHVDGTGRSVAQSH